MNLSVHERDGYAAAVRGEPITASPWQPGTLGDAAWRFGWGLGKLPRPLRWIARLLL